jgi:hypothetical protein
MRTWLTTLNLRSALISLSPMVSTRSKRLPFTCHPPQAKFLRYRQKGRRDNLQARKVSTSHRRMFQSARCGLINIPYLAVGMSPQGALHAQHARRPARPRKTWCATNNTRVEIKVVCSSVHATRTTSEKTTSSDTSRHATLSNRSTVIKSKTYYPHQHSLEQQ